MYVAVKGGERAIEQSLQLLAEARRGDTREPELSLAQIKQQMRLAVARVMTEGSLYDEDLAALAIKQASGDLIEAIFLLRAFRTTLPRLGNTEIIDTGLMRLERRISATFKDLPGGQVLGPTYDYSLRLLNFDLRETAQQNIETPQPITATSSASPHAPLNAPTVTGLLSREGLLEYAAASESTLPTVDITQAPLLFPTSRATRLQNLARGDEGFLLALGYSTQRGYANTHPFVAEIRYGQTPISLFVEELGFSIEIGEISLTECQLITDFPGTSETAPQFTRGYGLSFGHAERKAIAMALVDRALRAEELGEDPSLPANNAEFVLYHSDNVEASGFVQHLKLPHYVDFQSNLELLRNLREEWNKQHSTTADNHQDKSA